MIKRLRMMLMMAVLGVAWAAVPVSAELATMGEPIAPHGFPSYYGDTNGLQLEPCLPEPAGFSTRPELCVFDPLDLDSDILVAGEIFWWIADASVPTATGDASLTLAIEGTFGGAEDPVDGQQISFGRTRIRVDTPVAGTYTVTHPYGTQTFEVTADTLADGINYTADIGAADFRDPAAGFLGTLAAPIGPYLTWPDYTANGDLQVWEEDELGNPVLDGEGNPIVLEQYVGDPAELSQVVGSAIVNENHASGFQNFFRVDGPAGSDLDGNGNSFVETDLFSVSGKVFDPNQTRVAHLFPEVPLPKLFAVGPVNRVEPFATPTTGVVTGVDIVDYPVGYPLWYQENIGTIQEPAPGLQLTLCNPGTLPVPLPGTIEAMCISDPIDPTDETQTTLRTGGESFYWSADAAAANGDDDFLLVLGLEGTFGGDESIVEGQQITFGRERIRIDTNVSGAGTYRITHPYGVRIFENVPQDDRGINFTADIGIADPADPDGAFVGTLFSDVGPQVLKWTTFNADPALNDPLLVRDHPTIPGAQVHFVGDPAIPHEVVGSPTGNNLFRVERLDGGTVEDGTWTILGETNLFAVSGQVFDPALFPGLIVEDFVGVFRDGDWYLDTNGNGLYEHGIDTRYRFGTAEDVPVVGNWSGGGSMQIGIFRNGDWYLDSNGNGLYEHGIDTRYRFGTSGDLPVVGDWNGDGSMQIGVFRNGDWYLDSNGNGLYEHGIDTRYRFGTSGDLPVVGDWNGDGSMQIGVFRNGDWYLDSNGNGLYEHGVDTLYRFGIPGDIPVIGDWNVDGISEIGVFRNGDWYLDDSGDGAWNQDIDMRYRFGTTGDKPVAGAW